VPSSTRDFPWKAEVFNRTAGVLACWILAFAVNQYRIVFKEREKSVELLRQNLESRSRADELNQDNETLEKLVSERTESLMQSHRELERTKRLSEIGRLSSTIAHEMRNPLAAMQLAMHNIQRKIQNPLIDKHLETINKKILESDLIIQNLLNFTRTKTLNIEKFDLCDLIKDCISTVSSKYVNWKVEVIENLGCNKNDTIEADYTQLKILISNILDNAYQALHDKTGTITVTVHNFTKKEWDISIADTGTGVDEQDIEKIFEPFYTTKSKGTGLGLAVCREIVEMHHGKIAVKSVKDKGTTFTITLPMLKNK
jgi:two-component system sensor histidine kinase AtoS